jgi:hypothetical protein
MSYPVTERFKIEIKQSHVMKTRIDILANDIVELTMDTITEGQMTEDRDQDVRRRSNFTAVDEHFTLTPKDATSLLAPFGNEYRAYRGVLYADGTEELIPQGVFGITDSNIGDTGDKLDIKCEGLDRSANVRRARFRDTFHVLAGTPVETAVLNVLTAVGINYSTILTPGGNFTTPLMVWDAGDDPWNAIQRLATSCGSEVLFDVDGTLLLRPFPNYSGAKVDWVAEEGSDSTLLYLNRRMQRDDVANWVVVTGESPDNEDFIPRGEAYDNNSSSPTYAYGKFGIVVKRVTAREVTTNEQAAAMAQQLLAESLGKYEYVSLLSTSNPAMQVGDLVHVKRERALMDGLVVLDQVSQPFVATRGTQAITRQKPI